MVGNDAASTLSGYAVIPGEEMDTNEVGHNEVPMLSDPGPHHTAILICFLILGAGVLLPFNAVITPSEFYRSLFRGTEYEANFMSWIIVAYNVSCILFGGHATATMPNRSVERRIRTTTIVMIAVLLVATILSNLAGEKRGGALLMSIVLLLTIAISAATAYLQVAVVTLANAFGPSFLGSMLAGQGFVGVIVSSVQLLSAYTHVSSSNSHDISISKEAAVQAATAFFAANSVMMVFVLLCFWRLQRTSAFAQMQERIEEAKRPTLADQTSEPSSDPSRVDGVRRYMSPSIQDVFQRLSTTQSKAKLSSFCIAYIFIITLSVFPSLTSRVRPSTSTGDGGLDEAQVLLFVAWHFVAFNVSDLLGRTLPAIAPHVFCTDRLILLCGACVARTALPSLLARCNVQGAGQVDSVFAFSTPIFFCLIVVLGMSNGILATNIFIAGPRQHNLTDDAERSLVAGLLSWWLTVGLAIGSITSFYVT
jgi:equilibrative nucleoside transporter 1/2/3